MPTEAFSILQHVDHISWKNYINCYIILYYFSYVTICLTVLSSNTSWFLIFNVIILWERPWLVTSSNLGYTFKLFKYKALLPLSIYDLYWGLFWGGLPNILLWEKVNIEKIKRITQWMSKYPPLRILISTSLHLFYHRSFSLSTVILIHLSVNHSISS